MAPDYRQLGRDDSYLEEVASDIWLMDNHKWSLYVWEVCRQKLAVPRLSLVHVDYHWDGVDQYCDEPDRIPQLLSADAAQLREATLEDSVIRLDSFIAPAVRRGMLDEIHFLCRQDDTDVGLDDELLQANSTRQFVHDSPEALGEVSWKSPVAFDLCLDAFNDSDMFRQGKIWPDDEIMAYLTGLKAIVCKAAVITISLSFDYSGTYDDTRRLAKLVVPTILSWRGFEN